MEDSRLIRTNHEDVIKNTLDICSYKENPIKLVGSSSLLNQQYFGDYDAITAIKTTESAISIFEEFNKIFESINKDTNLYFIEFKIQTSNNKFRYYKNNKLDLKTIESNYKNIIFFKLDLSVWSNYHFTDFSVIYNLFTDKLSIPHLSKSLTEDINELTKEGQYYKALKRKYSIYKLNGDTIKMKELTDIFNSDLGFKYKVASNLEAMDLVKDHYNDLLTRKRIKINLDYLKLYDYNLNDLMKHAKNMKKEINLEAEKIYHDF